MTWTKADFEKLNQQQLLLRLLKSVQLFSGFSLDQLMTLLAHAEKSVFKSGAQIIREGDDDAFMYVIVAGKVSILKRLPSGEDRALAELGAGDSFGEMALVDRQERSASVTAMSDCTLLRIDNCHFPEMPAIGALLYQNIAALLSRRLRGTNAAISLLLAKD